MGPRVQSVNRSSSPIHAASHPAVNRVLDFEQEESVLQNNSALSGSGQHRGSRQSIYDIEQSPSDGEGAAQEEAIFENVDMEDSAMLDGIIEESYDDDVENEANIGADAEVDVEVEETEEPEEPEETEVATEIPKPPAKRGRKRKSEAMEPPIEDDTPRSRRRGATSAQASKTQKGKKGAAPAEEALPRRSKRVSEIFDEESSISMDVSGASIVAVESPPVVAKRRGRSLKNKAPVEPVEPVEAPAPAPKKKKSSKEKVQQQEKSPEEPQPIEPEEPEEHVFKKPKSVSKPKKKTEPKPVEKESEQAQEAGKLVTVLRKPISKEDMDQMSATSTGTRYGRGRHLSIYRELEPDKVATVGQTGRHRVKPIDFWRNESIAYDWKRDMKVILRKEYEEPPPSKYKSKGNKRKIAAIEDEEEIELEPWEAQNGTFEGLFRDYDAIAEVASDGLLEACTFYYQVAPS
jgi:centromere protein C